MNTLVVLAFNVVNLWASHLRDSVLGNGGPAFFPGFLGFFSSFFLEVTGAALSLLVYLQVHKVKSVA
jgi:hypothetical protein